MAGASYESPTEYINHHLTFMVKQVGDTSFWSINTDTVVTSIVLGFIGLGFMWWVTQRGSGIWQPGKWQWLAGYMQAGYKKADGNRSRSLHLHSISRTTHKIHPGVD